jgi:hypothetical protein
MAAVAGVVVAVVLITHFGLFGASFAVFRQQWGSPRKFK